VIGSLISRVALHCNRRIVQATVEKGGDYCIALKGNQKSLLSNARACLAQADDPKAKKKHSEASAEPSGHGRSKTRVAVVVEARAIAEYHEFPDLTAFGRIEATRVIDGRTEIEVRIFPCRARSHRRHLLATARSHWQIKNALVL
jgi:hypothetical protein